VRPIRRPGRAAWSQRGFASKEEWWAWSIRRHGLPNAPGGTGRMRRSDLPPLPAFVNHGRWVAVCPCGAGIGVDPDDPDAGCIECGRIYRIDFPPPAQVRRIERALLLRPEANQNWERGETVADLERENRDRRVPDLPEPVPHDPRPRLREEQ